MSTILIIEDSGFSRRRLVEILGADGSETLEAANGYEGVEKAEKLKPDCIVLDLLMPEMDGFGVLKALKERSLTIPVIVLSADVQDTTQTECRQLGAVTFIKKPLNENELLDAVHSILCSKGKANS